MNIFYIVSILIIIMFGVSSCAKSNISSLVLIEEMNERDDFIMLERSPSDTRHELVFAIKQLNLDQLNNILTEISSPGSLRYQKWLTNEEVGNIVSNSNGTNNVVKWLESEGVFVSWSSQHFEYLKATANISVWERVLNTQFFQYQQLQSDVGNDDSNDDFDGDDDHAILSTIRNKRKLSNSPPIIYHRAKSYYLPVELTAHLSAIFNTVQVPPKLQDKYQQLDDEFTGTENLSVKEKRKISKRSKIQSTVPEANSVTVPFLNSLYNIPSNIGSSAIKQSVIETSQEYFSPQDLTLFQSTFNLTTQGALDHMGFNTSDCSGVSGNCFEGNLDIQYIMGIAQKTTSVYWYSSAAKSDPFLSWITDVANMPNPPTSNSISWSINEQFVSPATKKSFNAEALKLAVRGVTIVVASGDNGVAGITCECQKYYPSFPATSPYVTAVGATMGPEQQQAEVACQSDKGGLITSGGGFSHYYPAPKWQQAAIQDYFSGVSTPPVAGFNKSGRAYPDVSFIGVKYNVMVRGNLYQRYGTSASAPVFAAMISLLNAHRLEKALGPVGFINPTLYSAGAAALFNDITVGENKCCIGFSDPVCCQTGFTASKGWDPVTGLGSVNFPNLLAMFASAGSGSGRTATPTAAPTVPPISPTDLTQAPTQRKTKGSTVSVRASARPSSGPRRVRI